MKGVFRLSYTVFTDDTDEFLRKSTHNLRKNCTFATEKDLWVLPNFQNINPKPIIQWKRKKTEKHGCGRL